MNRENAAMVGVGAAACAACCAGPILGVLAAIGLGTAAGMLVFGAGALILGAVAAVMVVHRRRTTASTRAPSAPSTLVDLQPTRNL
jgi:hypothetical protein